MNTVLVTGATSGIGKACVIKFAKEGYGIIALGRDKKRLEKIQTDALSMGAKVCRIFSIDFQNLDEINTLFEKLIDIEYIDAIVNSAGIAYKSEIENITTREWDEVMRVNVTAPFIVIQAALPWLLKSNNPSVLDVVVASSLDELSPVAAASSFFSSFVVSSSSPSLSLLYIKPNNS